MEHDELVDIRVVAFSPKYCSFKRLLLGRLAVSVQYSQITTPRRESQLNDFHPAIVSIFGTDVKFCFQPYMRIAEVVDMDDATIVN